MTLKMKNLKNDVHILFKIKGGQVAEFKELAENVIVPKPRKRKNIERKETKSKVYLFQKDSSNNIELNSEVLPYLSLKFNPIIGIVGVIIFGIGIFLNNFIVSIIGAILTLLGIIHIIKQVMKKEFRSNLSYNVGVSKFNSMKYKKANTYFKKALSINIQNEYAEFALNKCSFYL